MTDTAVTPKQLARLRSFVASLSLVLAGLVAGSLLFEGFCQLYARLVVYPQLDRLLEHRRHYLARSDNPVLGYELASGYQIESDGKRLAINSWGLRDDSDDLYEGKHKIALLGDSVVMSHGHSQERTLSALLQESLRRAGEDVIVLNLGVGGYGFEELIEFLRVKNALYQVDDVVYLFNANDYALRDSIYEGADNGTYRLYHRPWIKSLWFLRKAMYRYHKGGMTSIGWYEWMFAGNEQRGYDRIAEMADYCRAQGCRFSVVLLPVGVAYTSEGYALRDMYVSLGRFLEEGGIPYLSPIDAFAGDPAYFFDDTDHFHDTGNVRMAGLMHDFLRERGVVPH